MAAHGAPAGASASGSRDQIESEIDMNRIDEEKDGTPVTAAAERVLRLLAQLRSEMGDVDVHVGAGAAASCDDSRYCAVLSTLCRVVSKLLAVPPAPKHLTLNWRSPSVLNKFGQWAAAKELLLDVGFREHESAEAHTLRIDASHITACKPRIECASEILNQVKEKHSSPVALLFLASDAPDVRHQGEAMVRQHSGTHGYARVVDGYTVLRRLLAAPSGECTAGCRAGACWLSDSELVRSPELQKALRFSLLQWLSAHLDTVRRPAGASLYSVLRTQAEVHASIGQWMAKLVDGSSRQPPVPMDQLIPLRAVCYGIGDETTPEHAQQAAVCLQRVSSEQLVVSTLLPIRESHLVDPFALVVRSPSLVAEIVFAEARESASEKEAGQQEQTEEVTTDTETEKQNKSLEMESLQATEQTDAASELSALPAPAVLLPLDVRVSAASTSFKPTQLALASRLVCAIESLYSRSSFSSFDSVDFRVFVPIFNQLVLQTADRVFDSELVTRPAPASAEAAPSRGAKKLDGIEHVFSYHINNADKRLATLRAQVQAQPRTLFLLIADECEWGATPNQGNDRMVNDALLLAARNVVVLLVSATPELLLASSTRLILEQVTAHRLLRHVPMGGSDDVLPEGRLLLANDERDTQLLKRIQGDESKPWRQVLQPLSRHVRWFEEQLPTDGLKFVLRSFERLLLVSTASRLTEHSRGQSETDGLTQAQQKQFQLSLDSSFEVDRFRLSVLEERDVSDFAPRSSSSSAAVSHVQTTPAAARTSIEESPEHRGRLLVVRLQRCQTGDFLCVTPDSHEADGIQGAFKAALVTADAASGFPAGSEMHLQLFDNNACFEVSAAHPHDSTQRVQLRTFLPSARPSDDAQLCFVPVATALDVAGLPVFESKFYFGELYHGYRSLSLYLATQLRSNAPPRSRLIRPDELFKHHQARHRTLVGDWSRAQLAHKKCLKVGQAECIKAHRSSKDKKLPAGCCFSTGHLLLADYVYHVLLLLAHHQCGEAPSQKRTAALDQLILSYLSKCGVEGACPLRWVRQFYVAHHLAQVKEAASNTVLTDTERTLRWSKARRHLDPDEMQEQHIKLNHAHQGDGTESMTETEFIVHQLLSPPRVNSPPHESGAAASSASSAAVPSVRVRGKMVVLRVDNIAQGLCFAAGLSCAMHLVKQHRQPDGLLDVAIIPDFGSFTMSSDLQVDYRRRLQLGQPCAECKCQAWQDSGVGATCANAACRHEHVRARHYEDLLHLPCIVLLNEKGRMGDTFPHSFKCMDLRLRYQHDHGNLRSVTQELGRMCRYVAPTRRDAHGSAAVCSSCGDAYESDWAYALVGHKLASKLANRCLDPDAECPAIPLSDKLVALPKAKHLAPPADGLALPRAYLCYVAASGKEGSYDKDRTRASERHERRLVLHAECQIGKTGSYLATIHLLRDRFNTRRAMNEAPVEVPSPEPEELPARLSIALDLPECLATNWNHDRHPLFSAVFSRKSDGCLKFPPFSQLGVGKYHSRVALLRLAELRRLQEASDAPAGGSSWVSQFIAWVHQEELPVCKEALRLVKALGDKEPQLAPLPPVNATGSEIFKSPSVLAALNYDGRLTQVLCHLRCDLRTLPPSTLVKQARLLAEQGAAHWRNPAVAAVPTLASIWDDARARHDDDDDEVTDALHSSLALGAPVLPVSCCEEDQRSFPPNSIGYRTRSSSNANAAQSACVELHYLIQGSIKVAERCLLVSSERIRVSAPSMARAKEVFQLDLDDTRVIGIQPLDHTVSSVRSLVFHCTFNRRARALLDYSGALGEYACRRILVVQAREFDAQVEEWGGSEVILQLPEQAHYPVFGIGDEGHVDRWVTSSAETGGIGYARLCVQLLAREWHQTEVWMLDDNITQFAECRISDNSVAAGSPRMAVAMDQDREGSGGDRRMSDDDVEMQDADAAACAALPASAAAAAAPAAASSLWRVASRPAAPGASLQLDVETVCLGSVLREMEELKYGDAVLRGKTGGWENYALIGTARDIMEVFDEKQRHRLLASPHRLSHCYSACLVNLDACFSVSGGGRPVLFPPRVLWEDIEFNTLAIEAGLGVVKYARFIHFKRNFTPQVVTRHLQQMQAHERARQAVQLWLDDHVLYPHMWGTAEPSMSAAPLPPSVDAWIQQRLSGPSVASSLSFCHKCADVSDWSCLHRISMWSPQEEPRVHLSVLETGSRVPGLLPAFLDILANVLKLACSAPAAAALCPTIQLLLSMPLRLLSNAHTTSQLSWDERFEMQVSDLRQRVEDMFKLAALTDCTTSVTVSCTCPPHLAGSEISAQQPHWLLIEVNVSPRNGASQRTKRAHSPERVDKAADSNGAGGAAAAAAAASILPVSPQAKKPRVSERAPSSAASVCAGLHPARGSSVSSQRAARAHGVPSSPAAAASQHLSVPGSPPSVSQPGAVAAAPEAASVLVAAGALLPPSSPHSPAQPGRESESDCDDGELPVGPGSQSNSGAAKPSGASRWKRSEEALLLELLQRNEFAYSKDPARFPGGEKAFYSAIITALKQRMPQRTDKMIKKKLTNLRKQAEKGNKSAITFWKAADNACKNRKAGETRKRNAAAATATATAAAAAAGPLNLAPMAAALLTPSPPLGLAASSSPLAASPPAATDLPSLR